MTEGKLTKKLFGGIDLTWPKLITAAVIAGIFTAGMAIIPAFQHTSFNTVTVTLEVWILSMGYIGYYMKKDKWWGYLILLPMIVLTGYSYRTYLSDFLFYMPRYILICLFCALAMILYPVAIFTDRKIRMAGAAIGVMAVIALTLIGLRNPPVYSTELMGSSEEHTFDDSYKVSLADGSYGDVSIIYLDTIESYLVHADLKKAGKTVLILESPNGEKTEYDLTIERSTYELTAKPSGE